MYGHVCLLIRTLAVPKVGEAFRTAATTAKQTRLSPAINHIVHTLGACVLCRRFAQSETASHSKALETHVIKPSRVFRPN
jgi:hypothetical protein